MVNLKLIYARLSRWAFPFYAQAVKWAFPVLAILLILSLRDCSSKKDLVNVLQLNLDSVAKQAHHFENVASEVITENTQLKAEAPVLKDLTDSIFNLKRENEKAVKTVQDYTRIIQRGKFTNKVAQWKHDTLEIPGDAVFVPQPLDDNTITVPRPFIFEDSTIYFSGYVSKTGVTMDSIKVENTVHFRTVVNKTGFLRLGRETTVQVLNSNPGITTIGVASVTVPHKVSAWHRIIKPLIFAGVTAIGINQLKK